MGTKYKEYEKKCEIHGVAKMLYNLFTHQNRMGQDMLEMQSKIREMRERINKLEVEVYVHKHMLQKHGILKEDKE